MNNKSLSNFKDYMRVNKKLITLHMNSHCLGSLAQAQLLFALFWCFGY
jgi:hypothetical protein